MFHKIKFGVRKAFFICFEMATTTKSLSASYVKLEASSSYNAVYDKIFGLYLNNDMNLEVNFDVENLQKTLVFTGKGKNENDFLKHQVGSLNELYGEDYTVYLSLDQAEFDKQTNAYIDGIKSKLEDKKALLDTSFVKMQYKGIEDFQTSILAQYTEQQKIIKELAIGNPSPNFENFMNYAGGATSLSHLKGSYIYIDVWATWCIPCIYEIPFLQKVEAQYHDKNIKFVSISIDNLKDEEKWRTMIKDKNLGGIQLLADNEFETTFIRDYYIWGIPRFILLDPSGNIVDHDAPRPSEKKLIELFDSLSL